MNVVEGLKPVFEGFQAGRIGFQRLLFGFLKGPFLLEEDRRLRNQLAAAAAHEETHRQLSQENERLRALIGFRKRSPWVLIPAEVIGHELNLWSRTLLVDKGARDGLKSGMAVITEVGLVGRVSEVGPSASRVILTTDSHFRVAATLSPSRISGLATGTSSGECLLTYLPLNAEIKEGEKVLTSGGRSFCPDGVLIGSAGKARIDASNMFLISRIRPAVQAGSLEEILIVRQNDSE
ncbi:MAG: rod shape-determining protein MreC [Candidatus Omnitrophica bacterium]|nr:rod shape-determining protein MreC [Candidatus Omnitrophota bacterium]